MKLSELIHAVWKDERIREVGFTKKEVDILIKVFVEHIGKGLIEYGKVKIQGLFTLDIRKIKGRKIRNPKTKEIMYSKDSNRIGLTPSSKIKKELKNLEK